MLDNVYNSFQQRTLLYPLAIVKDVGPAVEAFSVIYRTSRDITFASSKYISKHSHMPHSTYMKQLKTLIDKQWIIDRGRQRTEQGYLRRTKTILISPKAKRWMKPYWQMPDWASRKYYPDFTFTDRVLIAMVFTELLMISRDPSINLKMPLPEQIRSFVKEHRRCMFSLTYIKDETGLSTEPIVRAKKKLVKLGILEAIPGDHRISEPDQLLFPADLIVSLNQKEQSSASANSSDTRRENDSVIKIGGNLR